MNTELLRRILNDARDNAANPSAAMAIEDLMCDVQDLDTLLEHEGADSLACGVQALDDLKELREHVKTQPFDSCGEADGTITVEELTPGSFGEWLAELERLTQ